VTFVFLFNMVLIGLSVRSRPSHLYGGSRARIMLTSCRLGFTALFRSSDWIERTSELTDFNVIESVRFAMCGVPSIGKPNT